MGKTQQEMIKDALIDRLHYLCDNNAWFDAVSFFEEHKETLAAGEKV
jgi:hypothetical protein